MNWDAIGAIGDMVAAAAVVVSLLYLAIQVRTQNREIRVSATHEILEAYRNVAIPFQSAEHARLFVKGNQDFECLEEWERIQIFAIIGPSCDYGKRRFTKINPVDLTMSCGTRYPSCLQISLLQVQCNECGCYAKMASRTRLLPI